MVRRAQRARLEPRRIDGHEIRHLREPAPRGSSGRSRGRPYPRRTSIEPMETSSDRFHPSATRPTERSGDPPAAMRARPLAISSIPTAIIQALAWMNVRSSRTIAT